MRSIYNLMKKSNEKASDDSYYPDVCTFDTLDFVPQYGTREVFLSQNDLDRKDLITYKMYQITDLDDLVLFLNNIPHYHDLEVNDSIIIYDIIDIEQFYNSQIK